MIRESPQSFARLLCNLRWAAVAGQLLTIAVVTGPMRIEFAAPPLWLGVTALASFNVFATWRARRVPQPAPAELFLQMLVDVAVLAWLVGWSGGISNPFSSLFLMPMALAVLALPGRWIGATAVACVAGYALSALLGRPLPHVHGLFGDAFDLHKLGMLVNFAVSAAVLLLFFTRMATAMRRREHEIAQLREQFARNEGIVALATHAASVAHELNTPLATLILTVDEMIAAGGDARQQQEDLATLKALLDVCRERVRELAQPADAQAGVARRVDLERVIERWQLVRPTIELRRHGSIAGHEQVDPAVGHLLQALLNNAADAGEQSGNPVIDLTLEMRAGSLVGEIRDYGAGLEHAPALLPSTLFRSSKPQGLGIGLALSHATVERLGGELSMQAPAQGRGVRVAFRLPEGARA